MTEAAKPARRRFIHALGALSALGAPGAWAGARAQKDKAESGSRPAARTTPATASSQPVSVAAPPRFAYVGSVYEASASGVTRNEPRNEPRAPLPDQARDDARSSASDAYATPRSRGAIHVFAIDSRGWRPTQRVQSDQPACLVLHPDRPVLYAVNRIDSYRQRCTGSVEAYAVAPRNGHLTLLNRQALSLSGTFPSHAAIAPDGRALVVALSGGGAYDVLPIDADGRLGAVAGILKETGCGTDNLQQRIAHPQTVMFDPTGTRILSADSGCDRLGVFTLAGHRMNAYARIGASPGSSPRALALHPGGRWLYVLNERDATIACYHYDAGSGRLGRMRGRVSVANAAGLRTRANRGVAAAFALHPSGRFLYATYRNDAGDAAPTPSQAQNADSVVLFRVAPGSGALVAQQRWHDGLHAPQALVAAPDGAHLYALNQQGGDIVRFSVEPGSGALAQPVRVAKAPAPACLVWRG